MRRRPATLDAADLRALCGLFFWTLGYDTIYAHQDKEDDALIGVKSTARLFGERTPFWVFMFYVMATALMLAAGLSVLLGAIFALMMLAVGSHFLWQVRRLQRNVNDPACALHLFRSNRDAGALIALALIVASWLT